MCELELTPNELRICPYEFETTGGFGRQTYWKVVVDGQVLWEAASPFDDSDSRIIPEECFLCGMCGTPCVEARRFRDYVVWYGDRELCGELPGLPLFFDASEYQALLRGEHGRALPDLTDDEYGELRFHTGFPDPHALLYVDSPFGEAGSRIVRLILRGKREDALVPGVRPQVDEVAPLIGSFDIGGDAVDFRWLIAIDGSAVFVAFCQLPRLPIWFRVENDDLANLVVSLVQIEMP